jgi:hypothetical protein
VKIVLRSRYGADTLAKIYVGLFAQHGGMPPSEGEIPPTQPVGSVGGSVNFNGQPGAAQFPTFAGVSPAASISPAAYGAAVEEIKVMNETCRSHMGGVHGKINLIIAYAENRDATRELEDLYELVCAEVDCRRREERAYEHAHEGTQRDAHAVEQLRCQTKDLANALNECAGYDKFEDLHSGLKRAAKLCHEIGAACHPEANAVSPKELLAHANMVRRILALDHEYRYYIEQIKRALLRELQGSVLWRIYRCLELIYGALCTMNDRRRFESMFGATKFNSQEVALVKDFEMYFATNHDYYSTEGCDALLKIIHEHGETIERWASGGRYAKSTYLSSRPGNVLSLEEVRCLLDFSKDTLRESIVTTQRFFEYKVSKGDGTKYLHFDELLAKADGEHRCRLEVDTIKQCVCDTEYGHVAAKCILLHVARSCVCAACDFIGECIENEDTGVEARSESLADDARNLYNVVCYLTYALGSGRPDILTACSHAKNIINICATFIGEDPDKDASDDASYVGPSRDAGDERDFRCRHCYPYVELCRPRI